MCSLLFVYMPSSVHSASSQPGKIHTRLSSAALKGKRSKNVNLMTSCGQKDADVRRRESEYLGLLIFVLLNAFVSPCLCAGPTGVGLDELKRKLLISDPQHFSVTVPRKLGSLLVWSKHASAEPHLWPSLFSSRVPVYLITITYNYKQHFLFF